MPLRHVKILPPGCFPPLRLWIDAAAGPAAPAAHPAPTPPWSLPSHHHPQSSLNHPACAGVY
jgi:hypothetical protein